MKKGLFKGNIKHEYISYIWITILLVTFIFVSAGSLLLYSAFQHESGSIDRNGLLIFSIPFYLFGVLYFFLTIFVIRKYPKYPKLRRRLCLNSDYYFVGNDSKKFHGHWRGRFSFSAVTYIGGQNKGLEGIKYPPKYRVYIALTVMGIVLIFAYIAITAVILKNIEVLPGTIRSEGFVFAIFIVVEILNLILSFLFAFRVKNIRKATIDEFRKSQMK